ncbi:hypothetical protein B0H34DRAFT_670919 [Crassisporium funariophilum]|nr:hypothetical protein B0H34DRAFT_670919 [Crassisporium funariophilum]
MQDNPEFLHGEPSLGMLAFLKRIESADPSNESVDNNKKGASWGHYQFAAGSLRCSTVITLWKAVSSTKIACQLIAAAVRTLMVAKHICKKQQLLATSLLSCNYVEKVIEALCTIWDNAHDYIAAILQYANANSMPTKADLVQIMALANYSQHSMLQSWLDLGCCDSVTWVFQPGFPHHS